ncbi:ferrous iron transporter B [Demequina aurantiaca]|uniref:ferrous iron transporter B n=1 Tax=Demequina aurantiaca TaxID=676200 RepID=UPI003D34919B
MTTPDGGAATLGATVRVALVGSPNSGKTTLFNALTGMHAKTGNYPGVTVARYEGSTRIGGTKVVIEDLPGTYSLDPISIDEEIVADRLDPDRTHEGAPTAPNTPPSGLVVTMDATVLRRSLGLLAQVLHAEIPTCVVVTFTDELARRHGTLDIAALRRALGVPVVAVIAGRQSDLAALRELLKSPHEWPVPAVLPPTATRELGAWMGSVLAASRYEVPEVDERTRKVDAVLLHPVWGSLIFFATMFGFFQVIFTVAAPLQDGIESLFAYLGSFVDTYVTNPWVSSFLSDAIIGGVGGVLVFLPQIALLFLLISLLEGVGYMSRAAFLMDRVMSTAGLEGRAFVALLSSLACAIPGIMATRTLPSARDRLATMMAAPLMTCSARLPVYILLIGLLVPTGAGWGPFSMQGTIMFGLYLAGAVAAMTAAWIASRVGRRAGPLLPFYMEMPPYRMPSVRSVGTSVWGSCKTFLQKIGKIILLTTMVLWLLLNLPSPSDATIAAAGVDITNEAATSEYVLDNSYAADVGKFVEPVFEPLGFDWRINIGVVASLAAREVFVATLGQVAAAEDPENPADALQEMTVMSGPREGQPLFTPAVVAALLAFFIFALQCVSTIAVLRRESGSWKWPAIAFSSYFVLAWIAAFAANRIVGGLV